MRELESIRVFLVVAEQSSFAGAARRLGLTPASVTRTIAALEDRLGVQLLVRTTRQVSLTSAGADRGVWGDLRSRDEWIFRATAA